MDDVKLCNMSLGKLGISDGIEDLEGDGTTNPTLLACQTYYEPTRDRILQQFNWSFARTQRNLELITDRVIFGYQYVYRYPDDCFQFRKIVNRGVVGRPERADERIPYRIFEDIANDSKVIATNEEQALAEYTITGVTPRMYSPLFVNCLVYNNAMEMAPMLKVDAKITTKVENSAQYWLNEAGLLDMEQDQEAPKPESEFEEARR